MFEGQLGRVGVSAQSAVLKVNVVCPVQNRQDMVQVSVVLPLHPKNNIFYYIIVNSE